MTQRSAEGRDITTQALRYFRDSTTDIIGVSCPRPLDDNLKATLRSLAALHDKQIAWLESRDIVRIASAAKHRHGLGYDEF